MMWLYLTILAYFFFALSSLVDRWLLSGPLKPGTYAFFVGAGGGLALLFAPFGLNATSFPQLALALAAGAIWVFAIFLLYRAIYESEVTRAGPAVGGLVPLFTLILIFLKDPASFSPGLPFFTAFTLLTLGGITMSLEKKFLPEHLPQFLLPAFAFSVGFLLMKKVYGQQGFISGFILMRAGGLLAASFLLLSKSVRKNVFKKKPLRKTQTSLPLVGGQIFAGIAFLLQNYAVSLVKPKELAFINALEGTRYLFLFLFVLTLNKIKPGLIKEKMSGRFLAQKLFGLVLICAGLVVLALR